MLHSAEIIQAAEKACQGGEAWVQGVMSPKTNLMTVRSEEEFNKTVQPIFKYPFFILSK